MNEEKSPHLSNMKKVIKYTGNLRRVTVFRLRYSLLDVKKESLASSWLARCSNSHHYTPNTHDTKQYQLLLLSRKYIQRKQNKEEISESSSHFISENPEHISMKFGIGSLY